MSRVRERSRAVGSMRWLSAAMCYSPCAPQPHVFASRCSPLALAHLVLQAVALLVVHVHERALHVLLRLDLVLRAGGALGLRLGWNWEEGREERRGEGGAGYLQRERDVVRLDDRHPAQRQAEQGRRRQINRSAE